jgi:hypothetical protein
MDDYLVRSTERRASDSSTSFRKTIIIDDIIQGDVNIVSSPTKRKA